MNKLRVLIVDDEHLARETIKVLLQNESDVEIIGEADNGQLAIEMIETEEPDVVFLDIQMPGCTGIDVAQRIDCGATNLVFVTAYDEYAIEAFKLSAVDYLLKPFDDDRFFDSLQKVRKKKLEDVRPDYSQLGHLINSMVEAAKSDYLQRIIIKDPGRIRIIDVDDVNWIAGAGNYAEIHLFNADKTLLHRETMTSLEEKLNPKDFVRIHRSTIVRRSSICELRPNEKGDYQVILKTGEEMTLSRRNKHKLSDLIG